jgi:flagellar biogenesis protein FliO
LAVLDQLLAIAFVLALLGLAVWFLGRRKASMPRWPFRARATAAGRLRTLERLPLTSQHCLYLVEVDARAVLVATHPAGVVFAASPAPFQAVLGEALGLGISRPAGNASGGDLK